MYHDEDILEAVTGTIAQSGIPNSASLGLLDLPGSLRVSKGDQGSAHRCVVLRDGYSANTPWPAFLFPRKVVKGRISNGL